MSKKLVCLSVAAAMVSGVSFAGQDDVVKVQNFLRVGYDDNVWLQENAQDSAEIIDVLNVSGTLDFSSRSHMVFSYQPELRYRFDADPKTVTYHDAYARFNHAVSQRVFLTLSDRLRYQQREAQDGSVITTDANYLENDLMASGDITLDQKSSLKLGAGYEFRLWDDDTYGEDYGNNFDHYTLNASYFRVMSQETTSGMLGVNYQTYDYDGDRGSLDYATFMAGADHAINANMTGFGRVGASVSSVDTTAGSEDSVSPYVDAGLDYTPSEATSFNGSLSYSVSPSANSYFNSQDRLRIGVGVRHDLTSKISLSSSLSYIMGWYGFDYYTGYGTASGDVEDTWMQFSLRGSYQVNRNNFVELGYEFSDRSADTLLPEYDRNRIDLGWRLRL